MKAGLTNEEWDALCDGCGLCCRITRDVPNLDRINPAVMCPGYDCAKKQCSIYDKRIGQHACIQLEPELILPLHRRGILPASCGYVSHMQNSPKLTPEQFTPIPFALAPREFQLKFRKSAKNYQKNHVALLDHVKKAAE